MSAARHRKRALYSNTRCTSSARVIGHTDHKRGSEGLSAVVVRERATAS